MAALTDVATNESRGDVGPLLPYDVPASQSIFAGAMVMANSSGEAVPAAIAASNQGVKGIATKTIITGAGETDVVGVERGQFRLPMTGLAATDIGNNCFAKDDATVGLLATNEPLVGEILGIDGAFAWVFVGVPTN